jgi:transposase InsO family protein
MNPGRAGCGGSRTSGSEGGPEKPTNRKISRALRPDPYTEHWTDEGKVYVAVVLDAWSRRVVGWSIADVIGSRNRLTRSPQRPTKPAGGINTPGDPTLYGSPIPLHPKCPGNRGKLTSRISQCLPLRI